MAGAKIRPKSLDAWGVLCSSKNKLDGERAWLEGCADEQSRTLLFATRKAALAHIREAWGYLARRPDLKAEPHGWRMPQPVRVTLTVALSKATGGKIPDLDAIPRRFDGKAKGAPAAAAEQDPFLEGIMARAA